MSDERLKAAAKEAAEKVEELARVAGQILVERFEEWKDKTGPAKERAEQEMREFASKVEPYVQKATGAIREMADKAEEMVDKAKNSNKSN